MSRPDVVVLDYGSGNLRSAERALARAGADVTVTADAVAAMRGRRAGRARGRRVRRVHGRAAARSTARRSIRRRAPAARPVLGICVGMQVLFEAGDEHGVRTTGCGEWPGDVERLDAPVLPHMGWNTVAAGRAARCFAGVEDERFYFVHSYAVTRLAEPDARTARTPQPRSPAGPSTASRSSPRSRTARCRATQFHPEKSGDAGADAAGELAGARCERAPSDAPAGARGALAAVGAAGRARRRRRAPWSGSSCGSTRWPLGQVLVGRGRRRC